MLPLVIHSCRSEASSTLNGDSIILDLSNFVCGDAGCDSLLIEYNMSGAEKIVKITLLFSIQDTSEPGY